MDISTVAKHLELEVQFATMLDQVVVTSNSTYERFDDTASYNVYEGRAAVIAAPGTGGVLGPGVATSFGIQVGLLVIYAIEDVAQVDAVTSTITVDPYGQGGNLGFYNQLVGQNGMLVDHTDWFPEVVVEWPPPLNGSSVLTPTSGPSTRVPPSGTYDIRITLRQASDVPWIASDNPSAVTRVTVP